MVTQNGNNFNDAIDSEDILVNAIRAIKQFIPARLDEVKKTAVPADKASFKAGYLQAMEDITKFVKALNI
jgi:hypothetical protein